MANRIYIPFLNPRRWYKKGDTLPNQYFHKYPDQFTFEDTQQQPWREHKHYYQKWQKDDIIYEQFTSNFSNISVTTYDRYGQAVNTLNAVQKRANKFLPGWYVYELATSLVDFPEGYYYSEMTLGDDVYYTDWCHVKTKWNHTLCIEYKNLSSDGVSGRYHGDVVFETGIQFRFRVEGSVMRPKYGSNDVLYTDQPENPHVLSSTAFTSYPLSVGGAKGIPPWAEHIHFLIWTCNYVVVDGKQLAKTSDTKIEPKEEENYPMVGIEFLVREGINRGSKIVEPAINPNIKVVVMSPINSRLFGDVAVDGSSNVITIQSLE